MRPPFSFVGELTSSAYAGAFFAELADALAAPAFAHRLALYVGHDGSMVRLLAGLGAFPLWWPTIGAEVVFEERLPVSCPIFNRYLLCPSQVWEVVGVASCGYFMMELCLAGWNGCNYTSLWEG